MTEQVFWAAVLGSPIAHSKSPGIHRAAYRYLNAPITYERIELAETQADAFMESLDQRYGSTRQLAGFSVTMPLKSVMVPHMARVSKLVADLGVLNTIVFDQHGQAHGYNTDVEGVRRALIQAGFEADSGGTMGILGAGGTATAAVAAAADMGLERVVLYVRNPQRAHDVVAVAQQFGLAAEVQLLEDFPAAAPTHQAVVATLPAHSADGLATQLSGEQLPPLLDVIYDPWPTALASAWKATGADVASGLDMLLYQGVEQAKLFTEKLLEHHGDIDWNTATQYMAEALGLEHA